MPPELRPAVVQDAGTGRVLMLAWMDDEAERLTRETGAAHFFSRSRGRIWRKGETSGNTLWIEELRDDCDGDALLLRVRPDGPACHTGSESCFAPWLWRRVAERARERPEGSYVASLLAGGPAASAPASSARRASRPRSPARERATSGSSRSSPTSGSQLRPPRRPRPRPGRRRARARAAGERDVVAVARSNRSRQRRLTGTDPVSDG